MDSVRILAKGAALLEEIAKGRASRQRAREAPREECRRPRPVAEETHDLEWTEPISLEVALEDARRSAKECSAALLGIVSLLPQAVRGPGAAIFGAASFAADRLESESEEGAATLALCVRIIDANVGWLDGADEFPEAVRAAAAARRCVGRCRRALAALYLSRGELV
jgi:hypothetical protein